ncbi:MAG: hypothetical protein HY840_00955 [Bacteroidetes bacterium]|nr:hypothetical protein [Bacteroidota bacterium]
MNVSDNWRDFIRNFNKMVSRKAGQTELRFEDLQDKIETKKIDKPNDFDMTLKGILSVPSPKE